MATLQFSNAHLEALGDLLDVNEVDENSDPRQVEVVNKVQELYQVLSDAAKSAKAAHEEPVQNLHRLIALNLTANGIRVVRTMLAQEYFSYTANIGGALRAAEILNNHFNALVSDGEGQGFLDTINTAYDVAGCGAILCLASGGKHPPLRPWWE